VSLPGKPIELAAAENLSPINAVTPIDQPADRVVLLVKEIAQAAPDKSPPEWTGH